MKDMPFELFLSDEVQALLDDFTALLDIRVTFFSISVDYLRRGKSMRNCDYCRMVQTDLGNWERCVSMDCDKRNEVLSSGKTIFYRCHAGLRECLAPVFIRDVPAGFVMLGQFRLEGDIMPDFPEMTAEQFREMQTAFNALPCFSEEKLHAIAGVLRTLIDYITVRELAVLQGDHLWYEIEKYIDRHATEDIRLPAMAKKLGRSVSTISQFLRKNHNTTFKELLLEARLKLAEQYWRKHPKATVAEVAAVSGFRDQFYFSRVFHRIRGTSPAKYRDRMKKSS